MISIQPSRLHTAISQPVEPAKPNLPESTAKPARAELERAAPSPSNLRNVLSRSRRDLQNPASMPIQRDASIRQFAEAVVEQADRQMALGVGNSLIRHRLAAENGVSGFLDHIAVPPDSTFGKVWGELADALNSEPFKSFAEAKKIDSSKLVITRFGGLVAILDNDTRSFELQRDSDWAAASSAVLAAANKIHGADASINYLGRERASQVIVARFYGLELDKLTSNDTLSTAEQLLRNESFAASGSADPLDAPIKQRQREARQRIVDLPPQALNELVDTFAPSTAELRVKEADQALAQMVSRGLMKLVPETGQYEQSVVLDNIPEHSTFNQVRKNLRAALTGDAFTAFVREHNLDPTSVRINPVSAEMTGNVKGVSTTFTLNDVSGWADVWTEIQDAVQQMAAGSELEVTYPGLASAPLYQVMDFYNEPLPQQKDTRQSNWEQRQLVSTLGRVVEINQNNDFQALIDANATAPQSVAVRQRQQAVIRQLEDMPEALSPLETLAAAVKTSTDTPIENEEVNASDLDQAQSELAAAMHRLMLELQTDPTLAASKTLAAVPANSLLGQWWAYLGKALKGHGFTEWAAKHAVDPTSLRYDPTDKALIAQVNGVEQRFTATDFAQKYPEHFDVLGPVLNAAAVFAAPDKPIALVHAGNSSVPFEHAAVFHGISTDPASAQFAQQMELIGRTQQLQNAPEDPQKIVNWLNRQRTVLGDSNDRYVLINHLKNQPLDDFQRFVVDADSSHQPKLVTTAHKFLTDKGWFIPHTKAEKDNLLAALQTPVPQSPPLGNSWGFLSTQLSLTTEQRGTVAEFVKKSIGAHDTLLAYLSTGVPNLSTDPEQALDRLISSNTALELASSLQTEMKGAASETSLKQWLLTALVLEVDGTAGAQHKTVAGIDVMGAAYSGHSADSIREQFGRDLSAKKGIPANLAPAIARLMMSGMAPQLLVKEVPPFVTLGSSEWVNFTTAVNRIEWTTPGATPGMTYQQVMNYNNIKPISAMEAQIQNYAQMNPLLDWAALNNDVNKDNYTLEQLKASQVKLQAQTKATAESVSWLGKSDPPNRRAMTLEVLRKEFGTTIDYERRYMVENESLGLISGRHYSLAEIHEAGRLGENWLQEGSHVDFERLRKRANEPDFPIINDQFDNAIKQDFHLRRRHTVTLFENMLKKLPIEERNSLVYGNVEFLNVEGAGSGMVITSIHKGVRRDFAVYPASGLIIRIADIAPSTQPGQKVSLEIDVQAFKNGTFPKHGVKSDVVLSITDQHLLDDNDEPWPLEVSFPAHNANDNFSPHYARARISNLASVMVDSTYLNKAQFLNLHRNWSSNTLETATEPSDFFKAVWHSLPGASSLEDLYHGEFFQAGVDLAIDVAIYVATEGVGKLWGLAKSGGSWAASKVAAGFIERFGAKDAESIALRDMTSTSVSQSLASSSRLQGGPASVSAAADLADGTVNRSAAREQIKTTAVHQEGKWYAYDPVTMRAYGPQLEGFVSQTSSVVQQETFADGTQALVTERPLTADAYTLQRAHGFDVVDGENVLRYDRRHPGLLTDLASADHFKPLEGFEALCPVPSSAGGRARRGANDTCFSKVIENVSSELGQELQALEHTRLFPSPPKLFKKDQFVIFERRRFKMVDGEMGPRLEPVLDKKPITYKTQITGSIKHDPEFGFFNGLTRDAMAQETRVIKLNSISEICNDQREVRAVVVDVPFAGKTQKYLVLEADTAEFYYAKMGNTATAELTFTKCTPRDISLVQRYRHAFNIRQGLAKVPFDANFIALPKLDAAFAELERSNIPKAEVNELKELCKELTPEQQREVLYQLQRTRSIGKANIALKPNQVAPLTKPADFASRTAEQQNRFYAERAYADVNQSMKATGLGPSNKVRSKTDIARADAANMTLSWSRRTVATHAANYPNLILKTGAGNCGEMALLSKDIITQSGGRAYEWAASDAHVFTVVGGPATLPAGTVDFTGDAWKDAWIVDPWADIACPARQYTQKLKDVMTQWDRGGQKILNETGQLISPLDDRWMDALIVKPKTPFTHGYNRS